MPILMSETTPKRILFIRPSALGDVCRSVPVIESLRKQWPDASIDWLVQSEFVAAVASHPAIDSVIQFPRNCMGRWYTPKGFLKSLAFLRLLKSKKYDLVIDGQGLARSGLFSWATRASTRIGLASAREFGWLGYTKKVSVTCPHTVDQMLSLSEAAGATTTIDMQLYVNQEDETWWKEKQIESNLDSYVVLAPTSRWESKQWPIERFSSLSEYFQTRGKQVVVVGAPHEAKQIAPLVNDAVLNVLPEMTVGRLMAVIASSSFVIANDSAALHMAVGFNTPCIGLFGPTDPTCAGPYHLDDSVVSADVNYDEVHYRDPSIGNRIMEQIEVQDVIEKIEERMTTETLVSE